jgi:hypothetical protein
LLKYSVLNKIFCNKVKKMMNLCRRPHMHYFYLLTNHLDLQFQMRRFLDFWHSETRIVLIGSHVSYWIYYYLCNQCLSPLMLWVRIPLRWGVLDTTLCDKVWQWLATGRWFSPGPLVSSTNKTMVHAAINFTTYLVIGMYSIS